nr:copia protein [Tanacetum cinerariifolium]
DPFLYLNNLLIWKFVAGDEIGRTLSNQEQEEESIESKIFRRLISILKMNWKQVTKEEKNFLWFDIKAHFRLENDDVKKRTLVSCGTKWKAFKTKLRVKFMLKKEEMRAKLKAELRNEMKAEHNLFSPREDDVPNSVHMKSNLKSTTIMVRNEMQAQQNESFLLTQEGNHSSVQMRSNLSLTKSISRKEQQGEQNESISTRQVDVLSSVHRRSNLRSTTSIVKLHCIKEEIYCCLYISSSVLAGEKVVCATATLYLIGDGILHFKKLLKGHMKVSVIKVVKIHKSMELPVPNNEIPNLESAVKGFIQWPIAAIARFTGISKTPVSGVPTKRMMPQHENTPSTKKGEGNETLTEPNKQVEKEKAANRKSLQALEDKVLLNRPKSVIDGYNKWVSRGDYAYSYAISVNKKVLWSNERPLENKELNAIIGAWFTLCSDLSLAHQMSMWLYKHKDNADRSLNRYKARLVANDRSQQQGIDCNETFSPVVKPATVRTVLVLAVSRQWPIHQLDVKNAFLHGHLTETVYMHQPPGFTDSAHSDYVCLLQKSFYGLKQAPRAYDIILTASFTSLLQRIISLLHAEFAMTDFGPLNYFLGISATRTTSGIFLSQTQYATEILEQAHMLNCNPCRTLIDTEKKLKPEGSPITDPSLYRSLAGSLQYLTFTRPDLSYAVQQLCLYMHDLQEPHPNAMKRVLRYLQLILDYIYFGLLHHILLPTLMLTGQDTLSCSSAEAEYRRVANAVAETFWIRNLLRKLHTLLFIATLVYCDNVGVYMFANPVQYQRTKLIEIDIHFVRDKVAAGHV